MPKGRLDLRVVDPKFHEYEKKPQQYLLALLEKDKKWSLVKRNVLEQFFHELNLLYLDDEDGVPYHNLTHSFDVTITLDSYLQDFFMDELDISFFERTCMLIAAYAHDNGHEGLNNNFYINNNLDLALKYSYISPLENMHASNLMRLIAKYELPIPLEQKKMMVSMILGTDMTHHLGMIEELSKNINKYKGKVVNKKDRQFLMNVAIHAADLNNATKPTKQHLIWTQKISLQFANQKKKQAQLSEVPVLKEKKSGEGELNFLNKLIFPFYQQLDILNPKMYVMLAGVKKNINYWQTLQIYGPK